MCAVSVQRKSKSQSREEREEFGFVGRREGTYLGNDSPSSPIKRIMIQRHRILRSRIGQLFIRQYGIRCADAERISRVAIPGDHYYLVVSQRKMGGRGGKGP